MSAKLVPVLMNTGVTAWDNLASALNDVGFSEKERR